MEKPVWKSIKLSSEETHIRVTHKGVDVNFKLPGQYFIDRVHPDILKLVEWLVFGPWDEDLIKGYKWSRKPVGRGIGLAFSGGVDSTAALTLLDGYDQLHLSYINREDVTDRVLRQQNAYQAILQVQMISGRDTLRIKTDMEKVRTILDTKPLGYSTDLCVLIGSILKAEDLGIKYLSTGMMLESTYLQRGYTYRDFLKTDYWITHSEIFKKAGFELLFPVIPCSEVLTSKIAESGRYYGVGNSCMRSNVGGRHCMNCYKCFRKSLIQGKLIPLNREAIAKMSEEHIKQGASLIHAYTKLRKSTGQTVDLLEKYEDVDYSFLEGYYEKALECIPKTFRASLKESLERYSKPMEYDLSKFKWLD